MGSNFLALWKKIPAPLFGVIGAVACFLHLAGHYEHISFYVENIDVLDQRAVLNFVKLILVDLTILIMAVSFVMRTRALAGPQYSHQILIALLGSAWPLLPFVFSGVLKVIDPQLHALWLPQLMEPNPSSARIIIGLSLMIVGNSLDIWGYATLFRSFSLVPEARELITTGPYRYIRHPIYAGHFLTHAGLWLFLATFHGGWVIWYIVFVWLQFARIGFEESVLESAFGEDYRRFKHSVWWPK